MAYRPELMRLLGYRWVEVEWLEDVGLDEDTCQTCRDNKQDRAEPPTAYFGAALVGEFIIHVFKDQRFPISTLVHELIHLYNRMVGPDNPRVSDTFVRGYESMLNDMVTNHWGLLKALRKEVETK